MRRKRIEFLLVLVAIAIGWLCIRFPLEISAGVKKYLGLGNQLDPLTLHLNGEFAENNLGTAREADGSVTVRVIAQQYNFVPACMLVPAGVPVHFRLTSADVVHRFTVLGTDIDLEAVPGHISQSTIRFDTPGDHATPCNEFCGPGHWDMRSRIHVVAASDFPKLSPQDRTNCDHR